jgi:hypothetical protein
VRMPDAAAGSDLYASLESAAHRLTIPFNMYSESDILRKVCARHGGKIIAVDELKRLTFVGICVHRKPQKALFELKSLYLRCERHKSGVRASEEHTISDYDHVSSTMGSGRTLSLRPVHVE